MRNRIVLPLALGALSLWAGDGRQAAQARSGEPLEASYISPESSVAMWIWTNKYVYQPGESYTLRWTVKTNNDLYPYTVVAYRQNNQTGRKTYLPGGGEEATDIHGGTLAEGFTPARLQAVEKQTLVSAGTIPDEPGMHTFVVELRDYSGYRVLKSAYMKIGVVTAYEDLQGNVESNRTLVNTIAYRLHGVVFVKNNATLTIEPGTFILGQPGSQPPSVLVVTRNGRIAAEGTKSRPIVMTSSQPFGDRVRGDWGGLILLGRAPINVGANSGGQTNPEGEFNIEGLTATEDTRYGGADAAHNCGTLRYVRVEYAGSIFAPNNESNSFTWGGCGTGTVAEHLQALYGLDDSFEWFGGTMGAKYLIGGLGADDYVDFQLGWTGKLQFGLFYQSADARGNRGLEGDNSEYNNSATPRSKPALFNMTFIGSGTAGQDEGNAPGIYLRRGAAGAVNNTIVTRFNSTGFFVDGATTQAQIDSGDLTANGVLLWNNGIATQAPNTVEGQVDSGSATFAAGARGQGRNFVSMDPLLSRPFEYSDPDFRPALGSPVYRAGWIQPPDDGFFDQSARFIGGIGSENWTEEWTNFLQDQDIKVQ